MWWGEQLCADSDLHDDPPLPGTGASSFPAPTGFCSVPLFCFCIWFGDSFKDANMPQHPPCSQPSLSCCRLTVIANICLTRCSFVFVNTLSSLRSQMNMILPLSFQILPCSHMPGQISSLSTHARQARVHRTQRRADPAPRGPQISAVLEDHLQTHSQNGQVDPKRRGGLMTTGMPRPRSLEGQTLGWTDLHSDTDTNTWVCNQAVTGTHRTAMHSQTLLGAEPRPPKFTC